MPMAYHLDSMPVMVHSHARQRQIIADWGASTWEHVCDTFPQAFTLENAAHKCLPPEYAPRTRRDMMRVILRNVMQEPDSPLHRRGHLYTWAKPGDGDGNGDDLLAELEE